jgi:SAM-dependent methyltransferase
VPHKVSRPLTPRVPTAENVRAEFEFPESYLRKDYVAEVRRELLGRVITSPQRARVLDVGCGDGRLSIQFADTLAAEQIVLVDLSWSMIELARRNIGASGAVLINGDVGQLPFASAFDLVLCIGVLAHVENPFEALRVAASHVVVGGQCVFQITDDESRLGRLLRRYYERRRGTAGYAATPIGGSELKDWAAMCGLDLVREIRYSVVLPGMGALPNRVLRRLERWSQRAPLARLGSEVVFVFQRAGRP